MPQNILPYDEYKAQPLQGLDWLKAKLIERIQNVNHPMPDPTIGGTPLMTPTAANLPKFLAAMGNQASLMGAKLGTGKWNPVNMLSYIFSRYPKLTKNIQDFPSLLQEMDLQKPMSEGVFKEPVGNAAEELTNKMFKPAAGGIADQISQQTALRNFGKYPTTELSKQVLAPLGKTAPIANTLTEGYNNFRALQAGQMTPEDLDFLRSINIR